MSKYRGIPARENGFRIRECPKVCYESETDALLKLRHLRECGNFSISPFTGAYTCHRCGYWHLGRGPMSLEQESVCVSPLAPRSRTELALERLFPTDVDPAGLRQHWRR